MADANFKLKHLNTETLGSHAGVLVSQYFLQANFDFEKVAAEYYQILVKVDGAVIIERCINKHNQLEGYLIELHSTSRVDEWLNETLLKLMSVNGTRLHQDLMWRKFGQASTAQHNGNNQGLWPNGASILRNLTASNHASPNICLPLEGHSSTNVSPQMSHGNIVPSNHASPYGHVFTSSTQASPFAHMRSAPSSNSPMAHVQNALMGYNMHSNYTSPNIHLPTAALSPPDVHNWVVDDAALTSPVLSPPISTEPQDEDFVLYPAGLSDSSNFNETTNLFSPPMESNPDFNMFEDYSDVNETTDFFPQLMESNRDLTLFPDDHQSEITAPELSTLVRKDSLSLFPQRLVAQAPTIVDVWSSHQESWIIAQVRKSTFPREASFKATVDETRIDFPNLISPSAMQEYRVDHETQIQIGGRVLLKIQEISSKDGTIWYLYCQISDKIERGMHLGDVSTAYLFNDTNFDHPLFAKVKAAEHWPICPPSWLDRLYDTVSRNSMDPTDHTKRDWWSTSNAHEAMQRAISEGQTKVMISRRSWFWPIVRYVQPCHPTRLNCISNSFLRSDLPPGSRVLLKLSSPKKDGYWCLICKIGDPSFPCDMLVNDLSRSCLFPLDSQTHPLAQMARAASSWPLSLEHLVENATE